MTAQQDLTTWVQQRIAALWVAEEDTEFQGTFDATFSPSIDITVNGETVSRVQMKDNIAGMKGAMTEADVKWEQVVTVPKDTEKPNDAGIVAGFYSVTRSLKYRVRVGPAQTQMTVCFHARVEQDSSDQANAANDQRRIVHLFQTEVNKRVPINFDLAQN